MLSPLIISIPSTLEELADNLYQLKQETAEIEAQLLAGARSGELLEEYQEKRINLLQGILALRELTWCACCNEILQTRKARLIYIIETRKYQGGNPESWYTIRESSELYRLCPACCKKARARQRASKKSGSLLKSPDKFCIFRAKKIARGYAVYKSSRWVELKEVNDFSLEIMSRTLSDRLTRLWNLPRHLEFVLMLLDDSGNRKKALLIPL